MKVVRGRPPHREFVEQRIATTASEHGGRAIAGGKPGVGPGVHRAHIRHRIRHAGDLENALDSEVRIALLLQRVATHLHGDKAGELALIAVGAFGVIVEADHIRTDSCRREATEQNR